MTLETQRIRREAIDRIARAFYEAEAADALATTGETMPPWDRLDKSDAGSAMGDARLAVDALGDLLSQTGESIEARLVEAQIRAVVCPDGVHRYLSTYCVHGNCEACSMPPRAPWCKTCSSPCLCSCHKAEAA